MIEGMVRGCRIWMDSEMPARRTVRTRDLVARLDSEGWVIARHGPGDHVQFKHPDRPGRVTVDAGAREVPIGTLRSIYRQAGWDWSAER